MLLTPREQEKLMIYVVADLARKRRGRGLKLNVAEATALIAEALLEGARRHARCRAGGAGRAGSRSWLQQPDRWRDNDRERRAQGAAAGTRAGIYRRVAGL